MGEAADGVDALRLTAARPDVALVEVRMPRMDGVELVRRLSEEHPRVAAFILTTFDDDEYVFGGLRAGAKGYLLKDTRPRSWSPPQRRRTGSTGPGSRASELSEREAEVVDLVGGGATNAEIARTPYISEGAARNHVSKILRKLGLRDRTQLAICAIERGRPEHR